jgi:peroxiredoxin
MKRFKHLAVLTLGILALSLGSLAQAAKVGDAAPAFTGAGSDGKTYNLSDFKGKWVVLEWHNQNCPFVVSQYKSKMEKLQDKWTKKGVVWFSVVSSAPGAEGSVTADEANADIKTHNAHPTAILLDSNGVIGKAYEAKTTPHMFVINPDGILVYNGAIDNAPREDDVVAKNQDGDAYVNYVNEALKEGLAGKTISVANTQPYGCHVKYAD